jgi:hypothetical protein
MPNSADDLLRSQHDSYRTVFDQTIAEVTDLATRAAAVQTISDLATCIDALSNRPEKEVFELAIREYQYALIAACHGSYRQAFSALRLSFELWLAAISFSGAEKELRAWRARKQDIVWGKLIGEDAGVLSKNFVSLFCPSLEGNTISFRVIAERFYRECSEYVHGNHHTHVNLPVNLVYDQAAFREWCNKVETFKLVCLFCFTYRYAELIPMSGLAVIGAPIGDTLGHLAEVRQLAVVPA